MADSELIESVGIDWLTMTWSAQNPKVEEVSYMAYDRMETLKDMGHKAKEKKLMQYTGVQCGKLFFGRDETHFYLNATSHEAHETTKAIIAAQVGGNATRTDVEITAAYPNRPKDFFSKLRDRIGESDLGINQRQPEKGSYYFDAPRDTGISLGGKKAERTSRFYSAREGGHPEHSENAVRFEYQYRQARARQIFAMMESAASIEVAATSIVTGELMALGLKEPWMNTGIGKKLAPVKVRHDIESKFKWYNSQVFPSFMLCIEEGYGEELFQQLFGALASRQDIPRIPTALELTKYKKLFNKMERHGSAIQHTSCKVCGCCGCEQRVGQFLHDSDA